MVNLLEVMAIYLALSFVAVSTAWALIARRGFEGLQQTNSPLARFFRTRFKVVKDAGTETTGGVVYAPALVTTVLVVTLVVVCNGTPNAKRKSGLNLVGDSHVQATTRMPDVLVINADLY
jgi:hypothetical protein